MCRPGSSTSCQTTVKYKFVYPAVVGPRYTENKDTGKDTWTHQPYMRKGAQASYTFGLSLNLNSAVPVHNIKSTSHAIDVEKHRNGARIFLKDSSYGGDRDFIMNYELRGRALNTGLMLLEGKKENFFLMMMQPPKRIAAREMPNREYVFIVDVSGSMHGFPLNTAKEVLEGLMGGMRARDKFNVLMFSGGSRVLGARSIAATPRNIARALGIMDGIRGGGGTRLLPALKHALKMPAAPNTSRTFVVITDGYVSVESEAYELVRNNLNKANLFAFGIGSSVNRHLVESLARAGMGEAFVVTDQAAVHKKVARFHRYISKPALTNINLKFDGFTVHDVEPKQIPDVFSERPIVVFGKYTGAPRGHIRVKGKTGMGTFSKSINVSQTSPHSGNEALRYLWARNRISQLSDKMSMSQDGTFKKAITQLGLSYNLLTQFTSFVAVDERVRNISGRVEKVVQPLPLPAGVKEKAVSGPSSLLSAMGSGTLGFQGQGGGGGGYGRVGAVYGMGAKSGSSKARTSSGAGRGMAIGMGVVARPKLRRKMKSRHRGRIALKQVMAPIAEEAEEAEKGKVDKQKENGNIARFKLVSVSGALRTQEVRRILNKWIARLLSCQNSGTSLVKIVVDRHGKLVSLIALSQNKSKQGTQSCMGALKSKMRFPTSRGKSTIRILLNH